MDSIWGIKGPGRGGISLKNIPFRAGVGDAQDLWAKDAKRKFKAKRFAGPFTLENIPYKYFVQSPMGLVPKAGGQTRLIFHLSYNFKGGGQSINNHIPKELCSVKNNDLNHAVRSCLKLLKDNPNHTIWLGITDLKSAFRLVPLSKRCWSLLIMKARDPKSGEWKYFVDKCLPFGAAISCSIFQRFSNALANVLKARVDYIVYK